MNAILPKQFIHSIVTSLLLLLILITYLSIQFRELTLFIINKAIADVAIMLLGIVVLIGPLGRLFNRFDRLLLYRKWIGVTVFLYAYIHSITTLYFLPDRFPLSRFHIGNTAFVFASLSVLILSWLFIISFDVIIASLNRKHWWLMQQWGVRIACIAAAVHLYLVKQAFWWNWLLERNPTRLPNLPPLGLLMFLFIVFVVSVRCVELFGKKIAQKATQILLLLFVLSITLVSIHALS